MLHSFHSEGKTQTVRDQLAVPAGESVGENRGEIEVGDSCFRFSFHGFASRISADETWRAVFRSPRAVSVRFRGILVNEDAFQDAFQRFTE